MNDRQATEPAGAGPAEDAFSDLLVVDDDAVLRERLARALRARGYDVRTAGGYDEAVSLAAEEPPARAVVDLKMPGKSGLELVAKLHEIDPECRIVVLTGYGSVATAVEAIRLGAVNFVPKPADADDLLAAFEKAEHPDPVEPTTPYKAPTLARAEWEHIQRVLRDCGGNISEAARRLGIHRRSLQRKLQRLAPTE